jgi:hypothetical protein
MPTLSKSARIITVDFTNTLRRWPTTVDASTGLTLLKLSGPETSDMPVAVLDTILGQICEKCTHLYPIAYLWPSLVTMASSMVVGPCDIRPNIYACTVGPVHSGKTAAIDHCAYLMGLKDGESLRYMKGGSIEGVLKQLVGVDYGVVLVPDELSHTLGKMKIENSAYETVLNSMFNHSHQRLTIAHQKVVEIDLPVSILGGLVENRFEESFGHNSMTGLYDRFLFSICPSDYTCLWQPPSGKHFNWTKKSRPRMPEKINGDVWERRNQWIKDGMGPRTIEIALRVAAICAAFDGRKELRARDLDPAGHLAVYQDNVRKILVPDESKNQDAAVSNIVRNYLRRHKAWGDKYVTVRDLNRHAHISERYGWHMLDRALLTLEQSEVIEAKQKGPCRVGRPSTSIRLLEIPEDES